MREELAERLEGRLEVAHVALLRSGRNRRATATESRPKSARNAATRKAKATCLGRLAG